MLRRLLRRQFVVEILEHLMFAIVSTRLMIGVLVAYTKMFFEERV